MTEKHNTPHPHLSGLSERMIQSVCDLQEVPDIDDPDTIIINVGDLRTIIENHLEGSTLMKEPIMQFLPTEDGEVNGNYQPDILDRMANLLDDLSPEDTIGFSNGAQWVDVATVREIRKAAGVK